MSTVSRFRVAEQSDCDNIAVISLHQMAANFYNLCRARLDGDADMKTWPEMSPEWREFSLRICERAFEAAKRERAYTATWGER